LPWIDTNVVGPVVSKKQFDSVHRFIQSGIKEGAKLELGGDSPKTKDLKDGFLLIPLFFKGHTQYDHCKARNFWSCNIGHELG